LGPDVFGDIVAAYLRSSIEGPPSFSTPAEAVRHFKREAERDVNVSKRSAKFLDVVEVLGVLATAILNPHIGREKNRRPGSDSDTPPQSVACFAAGDAGIASAAGALIVRLLRFGPTRVAAWGLLRDLLRWSDDEHARGAVSIVKSTFAVLTPSERDRFQEHLKRWCRDQAIRTTVESYFRSTSSAPPHA
jgi:hypothetical protein